MPLTPAKCTNCGALLEVDTSNDAAICKYCGTPFIIEKAVQHFFNTYNVVIKDSVVNFYGNDIEKGFTIRGGVLEKYAGVSMNVIIPDTVRIIKSDAFSGLAIDSVEIPDSVNEIQNRAFSGCNSLKEITIPGSVKKIGDSSNYSGAFQDCKSLKNVKLLEGIEEIGAYCFKGCTSLEYISIPSSIKAIGSYGEYEDGDKYYISIFGRDIGCKSLQKVDFASNLVETQFRFAFHGTSWYYQCTPEGREELRKEQLQNQRRMWRQEGKCENCGSSSFSFITGRCKQCGKYCGKEFQF